MSVLIVQLTIKQWDKSQRGETHRQARAAIQDRHVISRSPARDVFDGRLILDAHRSDGTEPVRCVSVDGDSIRCGRLLFDWNARSVVYQSASKRRVLGSPSAGTWLRCRYDWRRSVTRDGWLFWLYEEVVVNTAWVECFEPRIFIDDEPLLVFDDLSVES